jgi:hypothetical protein
MVAWHEVPGIAPVCDPSRRDGMIGGCYARDGSLTPASVAFESPLAHVRSWGCARSYRPYGTEPLGTTSQALRARLPSASPYGTEDLPFSTVC